MRILITGYPNTGKHDIAKRLPGHIRKTDDLLDISINKTERSAILAKMIEQMEEGDIIVGTLIPWGLRKWLDIYADGKKTPCDLLFLTKSYPNRDDLEKVVGLIKATDTTMWEVVNHPKWNPYLRPLETQLWMW